MNNKTLITFAIAILSTACNHGSSSDAEDTDGLDSLPSATEDSDSHGTGNPEDDDGGGDDDDDGGDTGAPNPDGEGPAELPQGRAIRRLTADQYVRSLEKVTGRAWSDYDVHAAAMGKADFAEITSHDRTLSVTFEKFANDAALAVCREAVDVDVSEDAQTILRFATVEAADDGTLIPPVETDVRANIQYLFLRFLADDLTLDDPRIDPWAELVLSPTVPSDEMTALDVQRERWTAVCVGLATHVDFLTY